MAEPPACPNPKCRKPMTFLAEEGEAFTFGCYSCGGTRIVSKPQTLEAARHTATLQRRAASEAASRQPRRGYSFSKPR